MGRKKYFCDYCQKAFNNNPQDRAMHLNSFRHLQLKENHYKLFRTAEEVLQEELGKEPCKAYHRYGECSFGSSCRFSHLFPEEINTMQQNIINSKDDAAVIPTFSEWLASTRRGPVLSHAIKIPVENLPLSLQPFDVVKYLGEDLPKWGQ